MKKTISLLLVLLLMLGLFAACSESETDYTKDDGTGSVHHYHHYSETVLTPADCQTEGLKEYVCYCGDSYTEIIPKTDHDFESMIIRQATCKAAGQEKRVCKVCGYSDTAEIPAAHQYDGSNYCKICGAYRKSIVTCSGKLEDLKYRSPYSVISKCTVTRFDYQWDGQELTLTFDIRKDWDEDGETGHNSCSFLVVIYDQNHNVIYSKNVHTKGMVVNEIVTENVRCDRKLDIASDYIAELSDYVF